MKYFLVLIIIFLAGCTLSSDQKETILGYATQIENVSHKIVGTEKVCPDCYVVLTNTSLAIAMNATDVVGYRKGSQPSYWQIIYEKQAREFLNAFEVYQSDALSQGNLTFEEEKNNAYEYRYEFTSKADPRLVYIVPISIVNGSVSLGSLVDSLPE